MNAENRSVRKTKQLKFVVLYGLSVILMGIIFAALWTGNKTRSPETAVENHVPVSEENELYRTDELLHGQFKNLQQAEQEYILLLGDSGSVKNGRIDSDKLAAADHVIRVKTQDLLTVMDSIKRNGDHYTSPAGRTGIQKLIASFEEELRYHEMYGQLRSLVASTSFLPGDIQAIRDSQNELKQRDDKIRLLGDQLYKALHDRTLRQPGYSETGVAAGKRGSRKEKSDNAYLIKVNMSLKEDNDRLLGEITGYKRLLDNGESVSRETQADLRKKVSELTDDLWLARVDCNLSRADARQIVSNSRQRKDLLDEALGVLKNLSHSENAKVQQKVREKTAQLRNIANTVRD